MIAATAAAIDAVVIAHQRGWDEFLLVIVPILLIVGVLVVVKRRVDAQKLDEPAPTDDGT